MNIIRNSVTAVIFLLCAAGIAVLVFLPSPEPKPQEQRRIRIVVPAPDGDPQSGTLFHEQANYEDGYNLKAPLENGEIALSALNIDFDNDSIEEQVVVFRSHSGADNQVSVTLFSYDERGKQYRRQWTAPVAVMTAGTVSLYTQDLIGDRSHCIIVTGMNAQGDHNMTVFRKENRNDKNQPFAVIVDIKNSGAITVLETDRPLAYQQGITQGQPFTITASARDSASDNIMDRVEITYAYNGARGVYEQSSITRVPGSQIEERRLREILTGDAKVFENFILDLWYHVTPQGTVDRGQYLFFDPEKREIIFFGDGTQQIFTWNYSNSTRYGLYISSQNISVTTLRRFLDIELESLDSIRIRVIEDLRLNIHLSASWNGSYRRAGTVARVSEEKTAVYTDGVYDSSMGRLRFYANGAYELSSSGTLTRGRYAFFQAGGYGLLELRPDRNANAANGGESRLVYHYTGIETAGDSASGNLSLTRVRLGVSGIQELHEAPVILIKAQ